MYLFSKWYRKVNNRFERLKRTLRKIPDFLIELLSTHGFERVMTKNTSNYWGDNLATNRYVSIYDDEKYIDSKNYSLSDLPAPDCCMGVGENMDWRYHIVLWAGNHCKELDGDFVEVGVWYGLLSRSICRYISFEKINKKFHLFDTWGNEESISKYPEDVFKIVKDRFSFYPNVILHRGLLPKSLEKVESDIKKISFLSIDLNHGIPERQVLEMLYEKIVEGGIIYFDDYGWNYPLLRKLVNEFFEDKNETLLHFACGSSILIKGS
tara:strand:- start:172 stop:969 length:798 start_codon:yes stop_codon:yes gene_type:complete